jgi:hypothetical protein
MSASTAASVSVVLVHGGFVDGSGWQGVYKILQQHGYRVGIVQNPTISLETMSPSPGEWLPRNLVRWFSWATRMAV